MLLLHFILRHCGVRMSTPPLPSGRHVRTLAKKKGYAVNNVDSTVVLERPKLQGYIHEMAINIAGTLNIPVASVNIKATTNEGMGFVGRNEGLAAFAVVTIVVSHKT